jgi:type II secretory pathway pseudopilin PulG
VLRIRQSFWAFTLIEIIITIVLVGLALIPLGIMAVEYMRGIVYSRDLGVAEGLARDELAKVNNLPFTDPTLADGYDNTTSNYGGYPYDLRRSVNYVSGNTALKQVQIRIYPTGDLNRHLVNTITYVANVSFGAGSGGELISVCLLSATPILMADGSSKPIQEVRIGDRVIAFDEKTGQFKEDRVVKFFKHRADNYLIVNNKLKVTPNHPIYSEGKVVNIGSLKLGDKLLNSQGRPEEITSIKEIKKNVWVYNLEVNPYHTYVAGGFVVHNKPPQPKEEPRE